MIKDNLTPYQFRVRFLDNGVERTQYTDDRRYYERLIAEHGHLTSLTITPNTLTAEQQQRLDQISAANLEPHDAALYVEYGTTEADDTGFFDADKYAAYQQAKVAPAVKAQRSAAEAQGVTVNDIRYAGDAGNRQALQEAIMAADDANMTEFAAWKDSEGNYHHNHPVADVKQALRGIGARRSALIGLEAQYVVQVADGEIDIHALDWAVE